MNFTAFDIIKESESLRLKAYPDPATGGKPITIGYGCTRNGDGGEWKLGDMITKEQAEAFFYRDFSEVKNQLLSDTKLSWLSDECIGAIASVCFNIGVASFKKSKCYKAICNKDIENICKEWNWYYANGRFMKGLAKRRIAELKLFIDNV